MDLDERRKVFLEVFKKAYRKYSKSEKRLAGESWGADWKLLFATILSAQSRDETTIPIAERLFSKYNSLEKIAKTDVTDIEKAIKGMNYYKTKARNIKKSAEVLLSDFNGKVPDDIDDLVKLPGVGRKTANLMIINLFDGDGICVDTHVHRISNVFGIVNTKTPNETEIELKRVVPRKYWKKINRIFVLWGKEVPGNDKERLLRKLEDR